VKADSFGHEGVEGFAAWSARHAPKAIATSDVRRLARSADVVALLTAVGLYPEALAPASWDTWRPSDWAGVSHRSWSEPLYGPREYAILEQPAGNFEGPPGRWIILLAVGDDHPWGRRTAALTFLTLDRVFYPPAFHTFADAKRHYEPSYYGRVVEEWREVPESVSRHRAETIAWLLKQAAG
jgi:hypothetical protein